MKAAAFLKKLREMPYGLRGFAWFCTYLRDDDGGPFKLHTFQRKMLRDYFDGITETVIVIPKKNGKTTLLAALALYHLAYYGAGADCVIGASSRDQARILFEQASAMLDRSVVPVGVFDVKGGYGVVRMAGERRRAGIRVMAADAKTGDGVIPTLALVDELHRHPSADLYGVFRDGLGPRKGRMITISTAGARADSPLGELRTEAHKMRGLKRVGAYSYAVSKAGGFAWHEWALDPERDNVHNMRTVKKANPAPWHTLAALQRRHDSPSTTPWQWLRFACGIWTEGEEPWIEPVAWDRLMVRGVAPEPGTDVWVGVDVGVRHDTTGIVILGRYGEGFVVQARILHPPGGQKSLPLATIEDALREVAATYRVLSIGYDPWSFRRSAEILADDGLPMKDVPQSPEAMSVASATLYRLITERLIVHDGDAELRAQVLAGMTKQTERGWRLVKDAKGRRPIDALIAMAIAAHVAHLDVDTDVPAFITL